MNALDLTNIKAISEGDESIEKELLQIFAEQTQQLIHQIKRDISKDDYSSISAYLHKMSNGLNMFNVDVKDELQNVLYASEEEMRNRNESIEKILEKSAESIIHADALITH